MSSKERKQKLHINIFLVRDFAFLHKEIKIPNENSIGRKEYCAQENLLGRGLRRAVCVGDRLLPELFYEQSVSDRSRYGYLVGKLFASHFCLGAWLYALAQKGAAMLKKIFWGAVCALELVGKATCVHALITRGFAREMAICAIILGTACFVTAVLVAENKLSTK